MSENNLISGKTSTGFKFLIDKRKFSDFRYLAILSEVMKVDESKVEGTASVVDMVDFILGRDQRNLLAAHVAEKNDGIASVDKIIAEFTEICNSNKEVKNSSPSQE